jgi:elongation of very long chain fatty acids protein 6
MSEGNVSVNATAATTAPDPARFSTVFNSKHPMNFNPEYMTLFEFERFEEHESWRQWMYTHWNWSVYASVMYVFLVFAGQFVMKNRQPFKLRRLLTVWNISLTVFSTVGFLRSMPELIVSTLGSNGSFHKSVCVL